jgi:hypothetical protein
MAKIQYKDFEYGQVYPPLSHDAGPEIAETAEPQSVTLGAPWWAVGWYIVHAAIVGAAIITLLSDAEGYCTSPLQPIGAIPAALLLWVITIIVRKRARRIT